METIFIVQNVRFANQAIASTCERSCVTKKRGPAEGEGETSLAARCMLWRKLVDMTLPRCCGGSGGGYAGIVPNVERSAGIKCQTADIRERSCYCADDAGVGPNGVLLQKDVPLVHLAEV